MNFLKSPLQLPPIETHITRGGSFRSFLPPAGKACVKLCLPGHFLEKHTAFLLIKSITGRRWVCSGSGPAGGFLLSQQPWDSHTCFSGWWAPDGAGGAGAMRNEVTCLCLPVRGWKTRSWEWSPVCAKTLQGGPPEHRVLRAMSFFFFFRKKEKPNNFYSFLDCFYKLFREDTSKGSLILNPVFVGAQAGWSP